MADSEHVEAPSWSTPALIALVAAGLTIFAVVAAFRPGANFTDRAFVDTAKTQEVQSDVRDVIVALYAFDPATIGGYTEAVRPLLTGPMLCSFDRTADDTVQFVTSTQTKADIRIDAVGVSDLGDDTATTIVSLTSTWSEAGVEKGSESRQLLVEAEEGDGRWLVADVTDLRESGRSDDCRRSN